MLEFAPLINLGAVGVVLGWFMFRMEPRLEQIEAAIDRLARAQMLLVVAQPDTSPNIRAQAQAILKELDDSPSETRRRQSRAKD